VQVARLDIPVAGGSLAAYRMGSAPADAPLVIAAHGITGTSHAWLPVARALGDSAAFVAVDHRGRGESRELPGPFGMAAHAADLLAVLDRLGAERAVLTGHSMGAYVVARFAVDHPERIVAAVLVDGGLAIPGSEGVDPQVFLDAFVGPAVARLQMRFASRDEYLDFWRAHPALTDTGVEEDDLAAYTDYDLVGDPPDLRSSVSEEAVRGDAAELHSLALPTHQLSVPAVLLQAPRGLLNGPDPMVPLDAAHAWAAEAPDLRTVVPVPEVNHYTITLGPGAPHVARAIVSAAA
jgi:pimeloyl-ACP methyl ester carboxylesterase